LTLAGRVDVGLMTTGQYRARQANSGTIREVPMRKPAVVGLLFLTAAVLMPGRVESQRIGGMIKKKAADAAKGKDSKKDQGKTEKKDEGPITSQMGDCGPLTREKVSDFLRGLKTEQTQRTDFDNMFSGLRPHAAIIACRNNEVMGTTIQKIMMQGMKEGASDAQLQKAMAKNMADVEEYLVKKCGEDPSKFNQRDAYAAAKKAGAKAAGLSDDCYDKLKEFALGFCGLSAAEQKIATEQGIKAKGQGEGVWVFTADEAKAFAPHCGELVPAIQALGYKLG
jgi:hypothetical protein